MATLRLERHKSHAIPHPKTSSLHCQKIASIVKGTPTVSLSIYDAIHSIRIGVPPGIPCILPTRKGAPVERHICVRDASHERLRDRIIGLEMAQRLQKSVLDGGKLTARFSKLML